MVVNGRSELWQILTRGVRLTYDFMEKAPARGSRNGGAGLLREFTIAKWRRGRPSSK